MQKFKTGDVVAEVGHNIYGKRGIVKGDEWRNKRWYIIVRWETGIETSEAPGRLVKI